MRCTTSIVICVSVTTFYLYMGPILVEMEQKEEVAAGQYKGIHYLVIFLVLLFGTAAVLEGIEMVRWSSKMLRRMSERRKTN